MYKQNFVMSIKVADKFLQETKDGEVFLPFLSEYSIFLKNKNNRRAVVKVEIDGKDILNGNQLVIPANSSVDLERFIENDLNEGRKFRFIEKTKGIVDYRGHQPEDGLIKISFKYEKKQELNNKFEKGLTPLQRAVKEINPTWIYDSGPTSIMTDMAINSKGFLNNGPNTYNELYSSQINIATNCGLCDERLDSMKRISLDFSVIDDVPLKDGHPFVNTHKNIEGITVKGSHSEQKFRKTFFIETDEEEYIMIIKLKGSLDEEIKVSEPITKKSKKICPSCGKKWDFLFTYCPDDSTFLENE